MRCRSLCVMEGRGGSEEAGGAGGWLLGWLVQAEVEICRTIPSGIRMVGLCFSVRIDKCRLAKK